MDVREKLVELLSEKCMETCKQRKGYVCSVEECKRSKEKCCGFYADHLIANGVTVDVREKTTGLNYEAEYNRLKEKMAKQNEENTYLLEELKEKEGELLYHQGFKAACELIFGRRYEHEC